MPRRRRTRRPALFRRWQILVLVALCAGLTTSAAPACDALTRALAGCSDRDDPKPKPPKASPAARAEAALLSDLNAERAAVGLRPLASSERAVALARSHARTMARRGKAYHNPSLGSAQTRRELGRPRALGENVGVGPSSGDVHHGFMRSTRHRANIVSGVYDAVGVGAVTDGYSVYVVEVFVGRGGRWTYGAASYHASSGRSARGDGVSGWWMAPPDEPGSTVDWAAVATATTIPVGPYRRPLTPIAAAGILLALVGLARLRLSR